VQADGGGSMGGILVNIAGKQNWWHTTEPEESDQNDTRWTKSLNARKNQRLSDDSREEGPWFGI